MEARSQRPAGLRGPAKLPLAHKVRTRNPHEPDTTTHTYIYTQSVRSKQMVGWQ